MNAVVDRNPKKNLACEFHLLLPYILRTMHPLIRFRSRWMEIRPRPYEPERQTTDVAWIQMKEDVSPEEAYRIWYEKQRTISRFFQQCGYRQLSSSSS
jgi:hypothetical protein